MYISQYIVTSIFSAAGWKNQVGRAHLAVRALQVKCLAAEGRDLLDQNVKAVVIQLGPPDSQFVI